MSSRLIGAGVVVDQDPLPGSPIEHGAVSVSGLAPGDCRCRRSGYGRTMTVRELLNQVFARVMPSDDMRQLSQWGPVLDVSCQGVTHDSRSVRPGWIFVALRGQKADGAELRPRRRWCGGCCFRTRCGTWFTGAVDRRGGCTAHVGVARSGIFSASEPAHAGGRHHGDKR